MRTIETVLSQWSKSLKGDPSSPSPSDKHDPSSPSFTHFLSPSPSLYLPSSSGGGEASSAGRQGAPARANDRPRQRCDLKRRPTGAICATQTSAPNCGAALRSMQQRPPAARVLQVWGLLRRHRWLTLVVARPREAPTAVRPRHPWRRSHGTRGGVSTRGPAAWCGP